MSLTKEQILAIPAGSELDRLIAVHVLGWIPWLEQRRDYQQVVYQQNPGKEPWKSSRYETWGYEKDRYSRIDVADIDPMKHCDGDTPDFSMDVTTAWQVVEKMVADGWKYCLATGEEQAHQCYFQKTLPDGTVLEPEAEAETVQLAICRAALLIVKGGE